MPLWKDPKTGKYRYQFQYRGRRYSKTGFDSQKAAKAAMATHQKELEKSIGTPTATTVNSSASDYGTLTLGALMVQYLQMAERKLAPITLRYRKTVFRRFLNHLGDVPVAEITQEIVEGHLLKTPTNNQFNKERTELMVLFSWAYKRHKITINPVALVEKMGVDQKKKVIPTPEEMKKIILAAGKDRPLILVLYHTLARIDEVLRLKWDDIDWERHEIRLWTRKRRGGGWHYDWLPMNGALEGVLRDFWKKRTKEDHVFVNPRSGTRYTDRFDLMRRICKRAGVRRYTYHCIRHFVASYLYDKEKRPLPEVSKLLRHTNYQTTERYLQLVDPNLRETMRLLEDFTGNIETATAIPQPV